MVDFPEGYGFAPTHKARLVQQVFSVDVGVFTRDSWGTEPYKYVRKGWVSTSPYLFTPVGRVIRDKGELYGYIESGTVYGSKITGTLQEICTAICTVHRMTGGKT